MWDFLHFTDTVLRTLFILSTISVNSLSTFRYYLIYASSMSLKLLNVYVHLFPQIRSISNHSFFKWSLLLSALLFPLEILSSLVHERACWCPPLPASVQLLFILLFFSPLWLSISRCATFILTDSFFFLPTLVSKDFSPILLVFFSPCWRVPLLYRLLVWCSKIFSLM